jgi:hypothetical protein
MRDQKDTLLKIISRYQRGTAVTPELDEAVKAAALTLEIQNGPPDLLANPD